VGFLALPAAAAANHLDGFVFNFESGLADPINWCTNKGPSGDCFFNGEPVTQFDSSGWSGLYLGGFGEESGSLRASARHRMTSALPCRAGASKTWW